MSALTSSRRRGTSPWPDGARVAAIRGSLNLRDDEALAAFGERARLEVTASVERLLEETRSSDVIQGADLLRRAVDLISQPDPARLFPKGLARLIVGRGRRLTRFRSDFEIAAAELEIIAGDLDDRAERLMQRDGALDRLHQQTRTFILELDAYREAATQMLPAAGETDARDLLEARLASLDATRRCAVEPLSLVRTIQNVDAPISRAMGDAARAMRQWRHDWGDLLGLSPEKRGRRIRPDLVALYETKALALERLAQSVVTLASLRPRRHEAELKIEQTVRSLTVPRRH